MYAEEFLDTNSNYIFKKDSIDIDKILENQEVFNKLNNYTKERIKFLKEHSKIRTISILLLSMICEENISCEIYNNFLVEDFSKYNLNFPISFEKNIIYLIENDIFYSNRYIINDIIYSHKIELTDICITGLDFILKNKYTLNKEIVNITSLSNNEYIIEYYDDKDSKIVTANFFKPYDIGKINLIVRE